MAYHLEGRLLEVCDCRVLCPCWIGEDPDNGACKGMMAWHSDKGTVEGVDVTGRTLAAIADIPGNVLKGNWRAALYLDADASESQSKAMLDVFTGKLGGAIADVAQLIGDVVSVKHVPIRFDVVQGKGTFAIGQVGYAELEPYVGATGKPTVLADTIFSNVPGAPAYVGKSPKFRVNQPALGIDLVLSGHN